MERLEGRETEILEELRKIHEEAGAESLNDEAQARWDELKPELEAVRAEHAKLEEREAVVRSAVRTPAARVAGADGSTDGDDRADDPFDLSTVRVNPFASDPNAELAHELRERAMRAIDDAVTSSDVKDGVRERLDGFRFSPLNQAALAERILVTGRDIYERAWSKYARGAEMALTSEERAALAVGADATGGFAVPYVLDPTVISTKDIGVSPIRQIANVITIATKEWRGVSSAGVTAAFAAEATEASDNAPTLAGPSIIPERAQAFVPFSYEIDDDWGALRSEIARMFGEAKEDLEATKFLLGAGHGSTEPMGVITALTTSQRVLTVGSAAFAIADVYSLHDALPARYRARASFLADVVIYSKIRQFDTSGGAGMWERIGEGQPAQLLGRPAYEASPMVATLSAGSKIMLFGDFSRFNVVDRIGLSVEFIPNLVGTNHRPTGQRGLYARWRTSSDTTDDNAFRYLETLT
jgi:HK97 family phage major capsid protein